MFSMLACLLCILTHAEAEAPSGARQLEEAFVKVGEKVGPTVVTIAVKRRGTGRRGRFGPFLDDGQDAQVASGVIIDKDGHLLTNEHVVSGARQIQVILSNGRRYTPQVVGADPISDLAVLKIDARDLEAVELGPAGKLKVGQWAIALGNPFGIARDAQPTLTVGVISGLRRTVPRKGGKDYGDLIQTDAAINPGNSGGPLVDLDGKLIGVNVLIFSTSGGYQGIGFAIPADRAVRIARALIEQGKVDYGWLGIRAGDVAEDEARRSGVRGAVVTEVIAETPAEEGGLRKGDVVTAFDGRPVRGSQDLIGLVRLAPAGKVVVLRIVRGGETRELKLTLRKREGE